MTLFIDLIVGILEIYKWLVLIRVLISWLPMLGFHIDPYHPTYGQIILFIHKITEPVLAPFRSFIRVGTMDFSPIIVFILITFVQNVIQGNDISETIAFAISLVIAFTVHEFAHAWTAYKLGDSTAKDLGRLTLDPRKHLDVIGSLMVLVFHFGWAKPVPVNPHYLRGDTRVSMAIVAAAGPLSNFVLACIAAIPLRLGVVEVFYTTPFFPNPVQLLYVFVFLNVILLFFNLIPIAPLDGFKVVQGLLPYPAVEKFSRLESAGPIILLLLVFVGGSVFTALIMTPTEWLVGLLIGI
ncbi:MAG: hypothetical protein B6242_01390 [Anaerolineaceae bacterium 4572_78]|nr:MAG: hypothetical protein B6242_01390 [Anaerolineaceae bacterium 4572_78]